MMPAFKPLEPVSPPLPRSRALPKGEVGRIPRAELDALRRHIAQLPNPAVYAEWLAFADPHAAQMLINPTTCIRGTSAADQRVAAALRPYGLCEVRGTGITAFGTAVRRRLLELDL